MNHSSANEFGLANICTRLMLGTALLGCSAMFGGAAYAQNEVVTVTGTSIRGAAPVGANIISVDRTTIDETAAVTVSELLTNIPQITGAAGGFGSSGQRTEGGAGGGASPNIHSLGTQASTATLTLIDGHVFAPVGITTNVIDPSIIPTAALQRVEVLPDGASAIYGANAVAGVVNFITRRDYSGWETRVQVGTADHWNSFSVSQLFGHTWDGGSVLAAYAYSSRSAFDNMWRKFSTTRQDIRMGALSPADATALGFVQQTGPNAGQPLVAPAGSQTTLVPVGEAVAGVGNDRFGGQAIPFPSLGTNSQNFNCPVAAISTNNSGNAFLYPYTAGGINAVPGNTAPGFRRSVSNGAGQGICDQEIYEDSLSAFTQNNMLVSIRQALNDRISVHADLVRGSNLNGGRNSRGNVSATVFNPAGTGGPSFGSNQTNPFYVGVPGASPTTNSQFITFGFDELLGPGAKDKNTVVNAFASVGMDVDLGANWALTIGSTLGQSETTTRSSGNVAAAQVALALNGTINTNGSTNVGVDPYGLSTVTRITRALTTANALDVWRPAATNRTSQAVLRSLVDNASSNTVYNNVQDVIVKVDGPLGDFWGAGEAKVAFGGNYNHLTQPQYLSSNAGNGPSSTSSAGRTFKFDRTSYAAFAELLLPLIHPDFDIPLVQRFILNMSGRYDRFSDFGVTLNPKVSVAWDLIDGVAARGAYSTSFVAPNVHDIAGMTGVNSQTSVQNSQIANQRFYPFLAVEPRPYSQGPFVGRGVGSAGTIIESAESCLALNSVPGLAAGTGAVVDINGGVVATSLAGVPALGTGVGQAYGCRLTSNSNPAFSGLQVAGGNPLLKPQTGLAYSAGVDVDAGQLWDVLDGLNVSVTYYNTKFMNAITNQQVTVNIPEALSFGPAVSASNPLGGWSITDPIITDLIAGRRITNALPARVYTINDNRIQNPYTIWQAGVDYDISYRFETDDYGAFTLSTNGNWIIRFSQKANSSFSPVNDINGCKNGARYCSSEMPGATFRLGWRMDAFTSALTFNFVKPYNAPMNTFPYSLPGPVDANGKLTRVAGYAHVGSLQTFDLSFGYTLPEDWISGSQISVSINNLLDKPPPFWNSAAGFLNGSQLGRQISVGITKKW